MQCSRFQLKAKFTTCCNAYFSSHSELIGAGQQKRRAQESSKQRTQCGQQQHSEARFHTYAVFEKTTLAGPQSNLDVIFLGDTLLGSCTLNHHPASRMTETNFLAWKPGLLEGRHQVHSLQLNQSIQFMLTDPTVLCKEKLWEYQNWNKEKWVSSHECPSKVSEEDGEKTGPRESVNATTSRGATSIPSTHNQCEPLKYLVLETAYHPQWSPG